MKKIGKKNRQKFHPFPLQYVLLIKNYAYEQNLRSVKKHNLEENSNGLVNNKTLEDLPFISSLKFGLMIMIKM